MKSPINGMNFIAFIAADFLLLDVVAAGGTCTIDATDSGKHTGLLP